MTIDSKYLHSLAFHSGWVLEYLTAVFCPQVGLRAFFGRPGQWFEENDLDGDKTSIFHDVDGTVTGYRDTYVGRADNFLIQHPDCVHMAPWSGVICSGRYSQVHTSLFIVLPL